jgi:uncharacterized protein YkwD
VNVTIFSVRRARLAAAGAAVAACAAMALAPAGAQAAYCGPEADQAPIAKREYLAGSATRCLINNEREARGLAPLRYYISLRGSTYVNVLASAAYKHNQDMVTNHFLSHAGSDGSTPQTRMAAYGWNTGEIIYNGSGYLSTPRAAVNWWMNSPGHRALILNPGFREFASAVSYLTTWGAYGGTYTVTFGGPS